MPINNNTNKVQLAALGITLTSANQNKYPISYSNDIWDIITDNSNLKKITTENGSYSQHEINEILADNIHSNNNSNLGKINEIENKIKNIDSLEQNVQTLLEKTFNLSLNANINQTLVEYGTEKNDLILTFSINGDTDISNCDISIKRKEITNSEFSLFKNSLSDDEKKEGRITVNVGKNDIIYKVIAKTKGKINITREKDILIKHIFPTYYGVLEENVNIYDESFNYKQLLKQKNLWDKSHQTMIFDWNFINSKIAFVIPNSYGKIKTLKDINNFDYINSYTDQCSYDVYNVTNGLLYIKKESITNNSILKLTLSWQ